MDELEDEDEERVRVGGEAGWQLGFSFSIIVVQCVELSVCLNPVYVDALICS